LYSVVVVAAAAAVVAVVVVVDADVDDVVALFCDLDWEGAYVRGVGWVGGGGTPGAGVTDMGVGEVEAQAARFCGWGRGGN